MSVVRPPPNSLPLTIKSCSGDRIWLNKCQPRGLWFETQLPHVLHRDSQTCMLKKDMSIKLQVIAQEDEGYLCRMSVCSRRGNHRVTHSSYYSWWCCPRYRQCSSSAIDNTSQDNRLTTHNNICLTEEYRIRGWLKFFSGLLPILIISHQRDREPIDVHFLPLYTSSPHLVTLHKLYAADSDYSVLTG